MIGKWLICCFGIMAVAVAPQLAAADDGKSSGASIYGGGFNAVIESTPVEPDPVKSVTPAVPRRPAPNSAHPSSAAHKAHARGQTVKRGTEQVQQSAFRAVNFQPALVPPATVQPMVIIQPSPKDEAPSVGVGLDDDYVSTVVPKKKAAGGTSAGSTAAHNVGAADSTVKASSAPKAIFPSKAHRAVFPSAQPSVSTGSESSSSSSSSASSEVPEPLQMLESIPTSKSRLIGSPMLNGAIRGGIIGGLLGGVVGTILAIVALLAKLGGLNMNKAIAGKIGIGLVAVIIVPFTSLIKQGGSNSQIPGISQLLSQFPDTASGEQLTQMEFSKFRPYLSNIGRCKVSLPAQIACTEETKNGMTFKSYLLEQKDAGILFGYGSLPKLPSGFMRPAAQVLLAAGAKGGMEQIHATMTFEREYNIDCPGREVEGKLEGDSTKVVRMRVFFAHDCLYVVAIYGNPTFLSGETAIKFMNSLSIF